jgi:hypothetical protein
MSIRRVACPSIAAIILICFAISRRPASGADLPDPCKLLTANEIHDTLRLAEPVKLAPYPRSTYDVFGFVGFPMPADDAACVAIIGDATLFIRVRNAKGESVSQVRAEAEQESETIAEKLGESKLAVKLQKTDSTACRELYDPDRQPKAQSAVIGMSCVSDVNGYELITWLHVTAMWEAPLPLHEAPPLDNLRQLTDKAASRI